MDKEDSERFDHVMKGMENETPLTPGNFTNNHSHICAGNDLESNSPETLVSDSADFTDYGHISEGNELESDSPGNMVLEFPGWLDDYEDVPDEELSGLESIADNIGFGETGIELFYCTSRLPDQQEYVEAVKLYMMKRAVESNVGNRFSNTFTGGMMNYVAHKGMFPGSDVLFAAIGAYEGFMSDIGRSEIDFEERYENLYETHFEDKVNGLKDILENKY